MRHALPIAWAVILVLSSGCHIQAPPDPGAGLGPRTEVVAPVIEDKLGMLFVDQNGTWVFRTEEASRLEQYEHGQVVAFGDVDAAERHLFGVVSKHAWGLRLQRLDSSAVEARNSGSLIPLNGFDRETGARWGFCAGSGDPTDADCLKDAPPGTRWRLYAMDDARLVVDEIPPASRKRAPVLPVELVGIVAVSALGTDVAGTFRGDWLAVPTFPMPRPTHPRIAVDSGCADGFATGDDLDATWVVEEIAAVEHPIAISSEAYRLGADALVSCDDNTTRVAVPGLYRRRYTLPGQNYALPPILAARPVQLRGSSDTETARLVARLGAAVSTGDWMSADYWNERLARHASSRAVDTVLVDTMVAVAGGGRPEAAAYTGRYATRLDWNPKTSPGWLFGMAAVEQEIGSTKDAIVRTQKIRETTDRSGSERLHGWFAYFWVLSEVARRDTAGEALESLDAHPEFRLLATASLARRGGGKALNTLRDDFVSADAEALHDALTGRDVPMTCETKCAPDVYGRIWAGSEIAAVTLSRVPSIRLHPGYDLQYVASESMQRAQDVLAVYPLLDEEAQPEALELLVETSLQWIDTECAPTLEETSTDLPDALNNLRRLGIDAALRMTDWKSHPIDATVAWLAIRGVPAACGSTAELAARASELAENVGSASVPARFMELHLQKATAETLPQTLALAAQFATRFERGDRCVEWNLALAAGLAEARRFEDAKPWLEATARCDVIRRQPIDLVAAYLNFERTTKVSADFGRKVRARVARVVHASVTDDACVGTRSLDYELTDALPEEIRALVDRLDFEPRSVRQELQVVTATDQVATALENLGDTAKKLDERNWAEAAKSLGWARDRFETVQHEVGLARVRWLDEYLFEGKQAPIASGEVEAEQHLPGPLRTRDAKFLELVTAAEAAAELKFAHALLTSDVEALRDIDTGPLPHREELCAAPAPRTEDSVVLDRQGGVLKRVDDGEDDEPPEENTSGNEEAD